jgi:hypothetical protein
LGDHLNHAVSTAVQGLETRNGKIRCTHENDVE